MNELHLLFLHWQIPLIMREDGYVFRGEGAMLVFLHLLELVHPILKWLSLHLEETLEDLLNSFEQSTIFCTTISITKSAVIQCDNGLLILINFAEQFMTNFFLELSMNIVLMDLKRTTKCGLLMTHFELWVGWTTLTWLLLAQDLLERLKS